MVDANTPVIWRELTLSQSAPLTGALIVTQPAEVSLIDARKGVRMEPRVRKRRTKKYDLKVKPRRQPNEELLEINNVS